MVNKAEFHLDNGNHILIYHKGDVLHMIETYEEDFKNGRHFSLANYSEDIKELYYNGRLIEETNFSFPTSKVDLHKFEG